MNKKEQKTAEAKGAKLGVYNKGQSTRRELIERASELFAQHGFDGTTLEAIAAAGGVTRAVPYRYFDSKRDLYLNCLESSFARFSEITDHKDTENSPRKALEHYLAGLIRLFDEDTRFRKLTLRSIMEEDQSIIDTLILQLFSRPVGDLAERISRVRPGIDARTAAYSAISIIVIDLETRKFGTRLKPQPGGLRSTAALRRHVLGIIDRLD